MVKEMSAQRVGRFLYSFSSDGKVTIAYRTLMDSSIGQRMVEVKLQGILEPTSLKDNVVYEGFAYPGLVYNSGNMSEVSLKEILSRRLLHK